jgi:hypothetical protein
MNYKPSPAMQKALDAMAWRIPAVMIRARKDAARRVLKGGPCVYVGDRPLLIAQRYIRFVAYLRRKEQAQRDQRWHERFTR